MELSSGEIDFLKLNLTNIFLVTLQLVQNRIISVDESEYITNNRTDHEKAMAVLQILLKKNYRKIYPTLVEILYLTNNAHCADKLLGLTKDFKLGLTFDDDEDQLFSKRRGPFAMGIENSSSPIQRPDLVNQSDILRGKLKKKTVYRWVQINILNPLRSHCKRRVTNVNLKFKWWPEAKNASKIFFEREIVKDLVDSIYINFKKNGRIKEMNDLTTISGLGGVGKTATAVWYANKYEKCYEYIFWIDCGENNLGLSFDKLSCDLKIRRQPELTVEEKVRLSKECYEKLSEWKCLFIFDNAESYVSIRPMLPINYHFTKKFHSIITSRHNVWGFESGLGAIKTWELDVFSLNDSVKFLSQNLDKEKNSYNEQQLEKLSELLGNLPLALQLTIATLNSNTISMNEYIDRIQKTFFIVDPTFTLDTYNESMKSTVGVSLELIEKQNTFGPIALEILTVLGYTQPDNVEIGFITKTLNISLENAKVAIEYLSNYSLVTESKEEIMYEMKNVVSIHRLVQQAIRLIQKSDEFQNLSKVVNCKGFLEYKIFPYISYIETNEELRRKFSEIKNQLIGKLPLNDLLITLRYEEAIMLSKMIHESFSEGNDQNKTRTSKYNYGICLAKSNEFEKAIDVFESLLNELTAEEQRTRHYPYGKREPTDGAHFDICF